MKGRRYYGPRANMTYKFEEKYLKLKQEFAQSEQEKFLKDDLEER